MIEYFEAKEHKITVQTLEKAFNSFFRQTIFPIFVAESRSLYIMQNEVINGTSLVSKSLPVGDFTLVTRLFSEIKTNYYVFAT